MSLTDNNNGMVMPVSPMYGNGCMGNGFGSYGDGLFWIQAGQRTLANEIEQYVAPSARPAYIVQNPNCCASQTFGCGCGAVA